jgi:copper chaperone
MTCGGCVRAVTKAVNAASPAAKIEVDLDGGVVRVAGGPSEVAIQTAIEKAGFGYAGTI